MYEKATKPFETGSYAYMAHNPEKVLHSRNSASGGIDAGLEHMTRVTRQTDAPYVNPLRPYSTKYSRSCLRRLEGLVGSSIFSKERERS